MSSFSCSNTLGKMRGRSAKSVRCYKRDREPSRIPKQKLFHLLKHRQKRKQIKLVLKTKIPRSSAFYYFYKTFKTWSSRHCFESCFSCYYFRSKLNISKKVTAGNRTFQTSMCDNSKPLLKKFVWLKLLPSLSGGMNTYNAHSSQMGTRASTESSSYDRLVNRLCDKGLQALDVGGSGDCFFKAISHQYYGTPDHHIAVRHAGVSYLEQHPDFFYRECV